jgi:ubiquinone/menaquinone biosynthesis C-methylase UbiE
MVTEQKEQIMFTSERIKYQCMFASGKIVNLGCGENPCGFCGEDTVHVDLDVYNHKNFVCADIHNLPFDDDEFDTAVLGDVLEHSPTPTLMLKEAGRVAKKVVATVFEEWRLDGGVEDQKYKFMWDVKALGFETHYDYLKSLPLYKDTIVSVTDDSEVVTHHPHVQMFTDESLLQHIQDAGLEVIIWHKFFEGEYEGRPFYNWLLVLRKKCPNTE